MSSEQAAEVSGAALRWAAIALVCVATALLGACSSGSGGSEVGEARSIAPTARAQVLNGGTALVFREGAEVLLTGKASEDGDGPVIDWRWRQIGGPAVQLRELNRTGVGFTAPAVDAPTELSFELTVADTSGLTGTTTAAVTIVPGPDSDKFLSLDIRSGSTFDHFNVVAALGAGAVTGATPKPFTLSAQAYLVYPPRSNAGADCRFDVADFANGMPSVTASGCHVAFLENLTPQPLPGGGTGIADAWPAGVVAPDEPWDARIARWWNPRFTLEVPRVDVRAFNQQFIDIGQRNELIESHTAQNVRIVLDLRLTAPDNQHDATLIVTGVADGAVSIPNPLFASGVGPVESFIVENDGSGLPTVTRVPQEALLAVIEGRESALTAEVYYRTVDPDGTRTTLNAWLEQAGFAVDDKGTLRPEAVAGTGEFAHAVYLNNYDLGFGREMYTRRDSLGNVFSFVKNYATLEAAIRKLDSFATVVTEFSPLRGHADSTGKFVKFFTYVEDGSGDAVRVASFDFDGRGERVTPGNCTVCHLGLKPPGVSELVFDASCGDHADPACYSWPARNRNGDSIAGGNLQSVFLPWDLDSLLFADTDPAITDAPVQFGGATVAAELLRDFGDFSRASQEAQLKRLNQAAYRTVVGRPVVAPMRALIEHWYGGVDATGNLRGNYDDSTPVPGWRSGDIVPDPNDPTAFLVNPPAAETIYHDVFARHCRSCHISLFSDVLRFDTYQELIVRQPFRGIYRTATMPGSRLAMDRFWVPFRGGERPGDILSQHIADVTGNDPQPQPGGARAIIDGLDVAPNHGDAVYLDGFASQFAATYEWQLAAPAGSAAALVGATTRYPTFEADRPGTYTISLTVNPGTANAHTSESSIAVGNRPPIARNVLFSLNVAEAIALSDTLLGGAALNSDPDGDPLTAVTQPVTPPSAGTVTIASNGAFVYSYTGNVAAPPANDRFVYSIADGLGGQAQATATILLANAAPAGRPGVPQGLVATDASVAAGQASSYAVELEWRAARDDIGVVGYNVYRDAALLGFVTNAAPAGAPVTFTDTSASPGTTHAYAVTSVDASGESALSAQATVAVATSLRHNIQTGWGDGTRSLWSVSGCLECHQNVTPPLLTGTAGQVRAALLADAAEPSRVMLNLAAPSVSTLLCKPLPASDPYGCPHPADPAFVRSDARFVTLLRWLEAGAPNN